MFDASELTGALGIGSVNLLAFFLLLDGNTDAFNVVEANADTSSWVIFMTLPLLFVSYVAGVLSILVGGGFRELLSLRASVTPDFSLGSDRAAEFMAMELRVFSRKRELLEGCFLAFLFLPVGVFFESGKYALHEIGLIISIFSIFISFVCLLLARLSETQIKTTISTLSKS